eukprot:g9093.t1
MSDSEGSDNDSGNILEAQQQATNANSGPLVSLEIENVQIGTIQDSEDEIPEPGEMDDERRKLNRRIDSSTYERITDSDTLGQYLLEGDSRRRENVRLSSRRQNTAPAQIARVENEQAIVPAPTNRVQGHPVTPNPRRIRIENAFPCGFFQGMSMDKMWMEGGSLRTMNNRERIVVERCSRFGDCFLLYYMLSYIVITNKRFIVKRDWKFLGFSICSDETSHHFANLQHVTVERGASFVQLRNRTILILVLTIISRVPVGDSNVALIVLQAIQTLISMLLMIYVIYSSIMFWILCSVNFLVVDIAKSNIVGSWKWGSHTRGNSYKTIRLAFPVDACFELMNELLKRHPLLPLSDNEV